MDIDRLRRFRRPGESDISFSNFVATMRKLRALHEEICYAWRQRNDPLVSEAEASIIDTGFDLLENIALIDRVEDIGFDGFTKLFEKSLERFTSSVYSTF